MGLVATGGACLAFNALVLLPWQRKRLGGRSIPRASGPVAGAIVVAGVVAASAAGPATGSSVVALLAFVVVLWGLSTAFVLRSASHPTKRPNPRAK
jgi:hypothetical protein